MKWSLPPNPDQSADSVKEFADHDTLFGHAAQLASRDVSILQLPRGSSDGISTAEDCSEVVVNSSRSMHTLMSATAVRGMWTSVVVLISAPKQARPQSQARTPRLWTPPLGFVASGASLTRAKMNQKQAQNVMRATMQIAHEDGLT
eukprot:CAMPEP_0181424484 /NCGR_PEP_ID=MMETSP1110-20121109/14670_1 /TAXON_ID=174948 /ORGANISM="Symbiodinium sp., Strain CCMP421" /LENGTH=145 /DNA_ID=CAMNT_0023547647 /DNA_START=803 /DNA_END=1243 /DNA_ORIENTATION=-